MTDSSAPINFLTLVKIVNGVDRFTIHIDLLGGGGVTFAMVVNGTADIEEYFAFLLKRHI